MTERLPNLMNPGEGFKWEITYDNGNLQLALLKHYDAGAARTLIAGNWYAVDSLYVDLSTELGPASEEIINRYALSQYAGTYIYNNGKLVKE